jgi:hypothetical protein
MDVWHFVFDDEDGTWTWRRISSAGEETASSAFSFRSFNVCVADAERSGYAHDCTPFRRVRASETSAVTCDRRRSRRDYAELAGASGASRRGSDSSS